MEQTRGILLCCCACLAVWLGSALGILDAPTGFLYDQFVRSSTTTSPFDRKVLLIEVDPVDFKAHNRNWTDLTDELSKYDPLAIGFLFARTFYSSTETAEGMEPIPIVFGQVAFLSADGMYETEPLPHYAPKDFPMGFVTVPPSSYGVHRQQFSRLHLNGKWVPSIEVALMEAAGLNTTGIPNPFTVNFNGQRNPVPLVSSRRVFSTGLVPELVKDRLVLIGFPRSPRNPGLHTPIGLDHPELSQLAYHGYALSSLAHSTWIRDCASPLRLGILSSLTLGGIILFSWLRVRQVAWTTWLLLALLSAATWFSLSFLQLWLPFTECVLVLFSTSLITLRSRASFQEKMDRRTLQETSHKLRRRSTPHHATGEEHWTQVMTLVSQTLDTNRQIFFEHNSDTSELHEMKALNCTTDEVQLKPLQASLPVYQQAIREASPVLTENYFASAPVHERHFVVPLQFAGQTIGFWALGIQQKRIDEIPMLLTVLSDFGRQISGMVYRHRNWGAHSLGSRLFKFLSFRSTAELHQELRESFIALEGHLNRLEQLMNKSRTATAFFDPFGRMLICNRRMSELMDRRSLQPADMTALDFLIGCTHLDLTEARSVLRHVLLDRSELQLRVANLSEEGEVYMLHVHPLVVAGVDTDGVVRDATDNAGMEGILIEVIDITDVNSLAQLKERVTERIYYELRNDLETVWLGSALAFDPRVPEQKRQEVWDTLRKKLRASVQRLDESNKHFAQSFDDSLSERYPIDAIRPLQRAVQSVTDRAAEREIHIDVQTPEYMRLAIASPEDLGWVLENMMYISVQDAVEAGTVTVVLSEVDFRIVYEISNTGFGMPPTRLENYLYGVDEVATDDFRKLRKAVRLVEQWGGSLHVTTEVGEGFRFRLVLEGLL